MDAQIRIELFGGLRLRVAGREISRFPTRKTASLLAYLAFFLDQDHPRESLIRMFWPESGQTPGRKSLSVALSAIRRELELPDGQNGAILQANHFAAHLPSASVTTDVGEFNALLESAEASEDPRKRAAMLAAAVELAQPMLLPGFADEWIARERAQLLRRCDTALRTLTRWCAESGALDRAAEYARRRVDLDPLGEEAVCELIRLRAASGHLSDAVRVYHDLEERLLRELGTRPGEAARRLAEELLSTGDETPHSADTQTGAQAPQEQAHATPPHSSEARTAIPRGPSVPVQWTLFVGRVKELEWLRAALAPGRTRLVTLTGPGGSGKTRLAQQVAQDLVSDYSGAVWFVPLSDLTDARTIPHRIAHVLELPHGQGREPLRQVVDALRGDARSRHLLVLDNFEHLAADGALIVRQLLEQMPGLTCLVTSRQRLNVGGEREYPVLPLPTPGNADDGSPRLEELLGTESVRLFLDRAQASDPGFRITEHNAAAVRTLCARLEGIPLALELAAARVAVLTPAQMVEQLQHPFEFLINRSRDAEARHRSLEAAIDWSYRLLPSDLRRFFASLSVFRGGWSLEAATFLAQLDGQNDGAFDCLNALDALDALSRMRECSLIVASEAGREMRYRMLETLREYAAAHLTTDELNSLHLRHRRWCLALVSRLQGAPHGPGELERLAVLDREAENVWASLDWTRRTGLEVQSALQLAGEMGSFWYFRGYLRQARDAMAGLLACPGAEEPTLYRGWVLNTLGVMMSAQGDNAQAIPFFEEALQLGRRFNSGGTITHALSRLAAIHFRQGEIERAEARFSESLALKRAAGERLGVASNLASLGGIARIRGDYGRARALYKEGLQLAREMNDNRCEALVLDCLGRVARDEGELARSSSYHQEALAIRNSLGDRPGKVITCGNLALVALREARYDDAAALFEETLVISQEIGDRASIASCRWGEAHVALGKGDLQRAETLMRESLELRRNLEQPGDVLEALEGLALVTSRTRRAARAATLLAAVERHSELLGAVLPPHERVEHEDALRAVRELLGCDAYQAARDRGASLTLAQAVDLALDQSSLATGEG